MLTLLHDEVLSSVFSELLVWVILAVIRLAPSTGIMRVYWRLQFLSLVLISVGGSLVDFLLPILALGLCSICILVRHDLIR